MKYCNTEHTSNEFIMKNKYGYRSKSDSRTNQFGTSCKGNFGINKVTCKYKPKLFSCIINKNLIKKLFDVLLF